MVRQFTDRPVPQHSLDRILANAVRGPSAGFCQGQAYLVLTGQDLPRFWALAGEATRPAVHAAPLVIVPLSCQRIYIDAYVQQDPSWADESRIPMPFWHLDTAMAALLILLTACAGMLAAALAPVLPVALAGFALTGLGVANMFPAAMTRAGLLAGPHGVAVASTLGYTGFLLGPPAIGFLASSAGLGVGLTSVSVLALAAAALAWLARS